MAVAAPRRPFGAVATQAIITGATIACVGALICTYAIFEGSFALFCVGTAVVGSFNGFAQYFRFAAAEAADQDFRAKAISLVVAGGVVAAVTVSKRRDIAIGDTPEVESADVVSGN